MSLLGQSKELLFVGPDQRRGAELFTAEQWPFVALLCSLVGHRGSKNKCRGSSACTSTQGTRGRMEM